MTEERHADSAGEPELRGAENGALVAGIKPGLRIRARRAELPALERRYRAAGFEVRRLAWLTLPWVDDDTLYIARSSSVASRMRELEIALVLDGVLRTQRGVDAQRELGHLLGYPTCCVDAFCVDFARHRSSVRAWMMRVPSPAYRAARYAWVKEPEPLLNPLLGGERLRIVSFEPCRFDCPQALAQARAIARAMDGRPSSTNADLERRLARSVVIVASGARALVSLERTVPTRIVGVEPIGAQIGRPATIRQAAMLRGLVGRTVGSRGEIGRGDAPPLLLDFAHRAATASGPPPSPRS